MLPRDDGDGSVQVASAYHREELLFAEKITDHA